MFSQSPLLRIRFGSERRMEARSKDLGALDDAALPHDSEKTLVPHCQLLQMDLGFSSRPPPPPYYTSIIQYRHHETTLPGKTNRALRVKLQLSWGICDFSFLQRCTRYPRRNVPDDQRALTSPNTLLHFCAKLYPPAPISASPPGPP